MSSHTRLAERLSAHLDEEYVALINGDINKIETLAEAKLEILERVSEVPIAHMRAFERLRERLLRHQILTNSAMEGMRNAILRARDVQSVSKSLRTYSASGKPSDVQVAVGQALSKRS